MKELVKARAISVGASTLHLAVIKNEKHVAKWVILQECAALSKEGKESNKHGLWKKRPLQRSTLCNQLFSSNCRAHHYTSQLLLMEKS